MDYLEKELDQDDPVIASQNQLSGEPMLYNDYRLGSPHKSNPNNIDVLDEQCCFNVEDKIKPTEFEYYEDTQSLFQKPTKDCIFSRESFHSRKNPRLPISYSYLKLKRKMEEKRKEEMDARRQRLFSEKPRTVKKDIGPPPFALDYDPNSLKMLRKLYEEKVNIQEKLSENVKFCNKCTKHPSNASAKAKNRSSTSMLKKNHNGEEDHSFMTNSTPQLKQLRKDAHFQEKIEPMNQRSIEKTASCNYTRYFDNIPEEDGMSNSSSRTVKQSNVINPNTSASRNSVTYSKVFSPKPLLPRTPPY